MILNKIPSIVAAVVITSLSFSLQAQAQVQDYHFGFGGQGAVSASEINIRQTALRRKISTAEERGNLTFSEATRLKNELNDVATMEARFKVDGMLSSSEIATLISELDKVKNRVDRQVRDLDFDNDIAVGDDIDAKFARVENKVERAHQLNKINRREFSALKSDLDQARRFIASARPGGFSSSERRFINDDLELVNTRLTAFVSDQDSGSYNTASSIAARRLALLNRINQASSSGRLTASETRTLRREYDSIVNLENRFKMSQRRLDRSEIEQLASKLDSLNTMIWREMSDRDIGSGPWGRGF